MRHQTQKTRRPRLKGAVLKIRYVELDTAKLWDRNPKKHDLGALMQSIGRHGFRDAPIFDGSLNGGDGGIVAGNGRLIALAQLRDDDGEAPVGVAVDPQGRWYAPVQFGVDSVSQAAAEAFGVDHNVLTLAGGEFGFSDTLRLFEQDTLAEILGSLGDEMPVTIDGDDLDSLLQAWNVDPLVSLPGTHADETGMRNMTFTVTPDQFNDVEAALGRAKAAGPFRTGNTNQNGNALARIAEVYGG